MDIYHGLQKRYGHAADREDASRQTPERCTHTDSHGNAIAYGNRHSYSNSNCDAEPDSYFHADSKPDTDSHSYAYTKSNGYLYTCARRHCFQWILVRDGENSSDRDLSGFLSDCHRDTEREPYSQRLGEGQRIAGVAGLGQCELDEASRLAADQCHFDLDEIHHACV